MKEGRKDGKVGWKGRNDSKGKKIGRKGEKKERERRRQRRKEGISKPEEG